MLGENKNVLSVGLWRSWERVPACWEGLVGSIPTSFRQTGIQDACRLYTSK
jgi:hypothetical protein